MAVLAACLPYNVTSYSEDDIAFAVRQGAAIERSVQERRLPPDVKALGERLADDVAGNAAYGPARYGRHDLQACSHRDSPPLLNLITLRTALHSRMGLLYSCV